MTGARVSAAMIGGRAVAVAVVALCVGCSSGGGKVICAPCAPAVVVTVGGLDRLERDGWRVRVCVGGRPCVEVRGPAVAPSCGDVACSLNGAGLLQIALNERDARSVARLGVVVTASSKGGPVVRGAAAMEFTDDTGPCNCDRSRAAVVVG